MKNKITLLGTGTCQLQQHRLASSALIQLGKLNILYDIGRGITQRLNQLKLKQSDLEHIVLSHYHPDHISDLIPYLQAGSHSRIDPRKKTLNLYGPPGLKTIIKELTKTFSRYGPLINGYQLKLHTITKPNFKIKKHQFKFTHLPPVNNHGLKFTVNQKTYAFTGDSDYHQQAIAFIKNVDLAIVDAGHSTEKETIKLAVQSQAKVIVCSHQYREINGQNLTQKAKKLGYTGKIISGKDLLSFNI